MINLSDMREINWRYLMQHYGLQTRLLDWSKNALTALYFAIRKYDVKSEQKSAAVWVLNLSVAGTPLTIPVYINPTSGGSQALGGYRTTVCFTPYDVPEAQGGAPQGAALLPKKRKENAGEHADLTDPEQKHPLNDIGAEVRHFEEIFRHIGEFARNQDSGGAETIDGKAICHAHGLAGNHRRGRRAG